MTMNANDCASENESDGIDGRLRWIEAVVDFVECDEGV